MRVLGFVFPMPGQRDEAGPIRPQERQQADRQRHDRRAVFGNRNRHKIQMARPARDRDVIPRELLRRLSWKRVSTCFVRRSKRCNGVGGGGWGVLPFNTNRIEYKFRDTSRHLQNQD